MLAILFKFEQYENRSPFFYITKKKFSSLAGFIMMIIVHLKPIKQRFLSMSVIINHDFIIFYLFFIISMIEFILFMSS